MAYTSTFKTVDGTKTFNVSIDGGNEEIKLAWKNPVVIEYNGDLYDTFKGQTCKINIATDQLYTDMYSTNCDKIVTVTNTTDNITLFRGYVTPCEYNQNYVTFDTISVEAVSMDSKLQYLDFVKDNTKTLLSFEEIITMCLTTKCGYNSIVYKTDFAYSDFYIQQDNFFDDDGEPWKLDEVLGETLKYMNCTLTIYNDTAYIIDYDKLNQDDVANTLSKSTWKTIARGNNVSFSLSETYNQFNVECNTYPIEEPDVDIFDRIEISGSSTSLVDTITLDDEKQKTTIYDITEFTSNGNSDLTLTINNNLCKVYKVASFERENSIKSSLSYENIIALSTGQSTTTPEDLSQYSRPNNDELSATGPLITIQSNKSVVCNSSQDSYFVISGKCFESLREYYEQPWNKFELNEPKEGEQTQQQTYAQWNNPNGVPIEYRMNDDGQETTGTYYLGYKLLNISIGVGNLYYDDDNECWDETEHFIQVPVGGTSNGWNDWMDITNSIGYYLKLNDAEGFGIKIPAGTVLNGNLILKFYMPRLTVGEKIGTSSFIYWKNLMELAKYPIQYYPQWVLLKEFEIKYYNPVYTSFGDYDEDVAYKIDGVTGAVMEADSIELKINTQVEGKKDSYSFVRNSEGAFKTDIRMENLIINSRATHFAEPKYILTMKTVNNISPLDLFSYPSLCSGKMVATSNKNDLKQGISTMTFSEI